MTKVLAFSTLFFVAATTCFSQELDRSKPYVGIAVLGATDVETAFDAAGLPKRGRPKAGVLVMEVMPCAADQGARQYDVIYRVNKKPVKDGDAWKAAIAAAKPGEVVKLDFQRFNPDRGGYVSTSGTLTVTNEADAFYSALDVSGSDVDRIYRATHKYLNQQPLVISPVIVATTESATMFLDIKYSADDWLFVQKVTLRAGNEKVEIDVQPFKGDHDVKLDAGIVESYTVAMPDNFAAFIQAAKTNAIKVKFTGRTKYVEKDIDRAWVSMCETVLRVHGDIEATSVTKLAALAN